MAMSFMHDLDDVRDAIYRCSDGPGYERALKDAFTLVVQVLGDAANSESQIASAMRTALVGWRYSYYQGTDASLERMRAFQECATALRDRLQSAHMVEDGEVGFACTHARVLRNKGDMEGAKRLLAGITEKYPARSGLHLELERGNIARYERNYQEALAHYREAARHADSPHGRVALLHYFAAAGCEALIDVALSGDGSRERFSDFGLALASLKLLSNPDAMRCAKYFPHQFAYVRKHEAVILALSGDAAGAARVMDEAGAVMDSLGSRKGRALVAYSRAVMALVLRDDSLLRASAAKAKVLARNYYPPLEDRLEELNDSTRRSGSNSIEVLKLASAMTPAFIELLTEAYVDVETRQLVNALAHMLTGEVEWGRDLAKQVLEDPEVLHSFWASPRSHLRVTAVRVLAESFEDCLATDRRPNRSRVLDALGLSAGGSTEALGAFDLELAAYYKAGIEFTEVAEAVGVARERVATSWKKTLGDHGVADA